MPFTISQNQWEITSKLVVLSTIQKQEFIECTILEQQRESIEYFAEPEINQCLLEKWLKLQLVWLLANSFSFSRSITNLSNIIKIE